MVGSVSVWQDDGLIDFVLGIGEVAYLMHHRRLLLLIVEQTTICRLGIELVCPFALEVEGVQKIAYGIGVELILLDGFFNHPLGVVAAPLVDDVAGLTVAEVAALGCCIVILTGRFHKGRQ